MCSVVGGGDVIDKRVLVQLYHSSDEDVAGKIDSWEKLLLRFYKRRRIRTSVQILAIVLDLK